MSRRKQPRPQHYSTTVSTTTTTTLTNHIDLKSTTTSDQDQDQLKKIHLDHCNNQNNNNLQNNNNNNLNCQQQELDIIIAKVNSQAIEDLENRRSNLNCSSSLSTKQLEKQQDQEEGEEEEEGQQNPKHIESSGNNKHYNDENENNQDTEDIVDVEEDTNNENYDCVNLKRSRDSGGDGKRILNNDSDSPIKDSTNCESNPENDLSSGVDVETRKIISPKPTNQTDDGGHSQNDLGEEETLVKKSKTKHHHHHHDHLAKEMIVENGHHSTTSAIFDQYLHHSTSSSPPLSMFDIQKFDQLRPNIFPKNFNFNQFTNTSVPFNAALLQSSNHHHHHHLHHNNNLHHHHQMLMKSATQAAVTSSHMTPTGKNLCDKCGGSYATLAALISHKKSCKSKKKSNSGANLDSTNHPNDGFINNKSNESDENVLFHHRLQSHPNRLHHPTSHHSSLLHNQISLPDEQRSSLNKLMSMEAAATSAMDNLNATNQQQSTTTANPLAGGGWPTELSSPSFSSSSPSSAAATAAAFAAAAAMPDMSAFLESFAPLFAAQHQPQANVGQSDHNNESSPSSEQQQAALFTQQMMLFHMFQQMRHIQQQQQQQTTGQASQVPSFPLLAAAAAAAAQHQSSQLAMAAAASSPLSSLTRSMDHQSSAADSSGPLDTRKSLHHSSSTSKHISRINSNHHQKDSPSSKKDTSLVDNKLIDEDANNKSECEDLGKQRPPMSITPTSDRSAGGGGGPNNANPNATRKLLSSLLDLKDTNPDAPLPPMMSPPKTDSSESVPFNEPNTLELLQKHTEQALQNTMSGGSFLLNGLSAADNNELLNFRKGKDGKEDPSSRHRCKFCGKVFGSDSALQIHIRSHTGERPFKCNVCGNRFTTKGNLKVHFQRHKAKYPHVKMNSHPVPEHLDKLYPPLEPASNSQSPPPPPIPPTSSTTVTGLFSPTTFPQSSTQSNTLHIPAIFSSTLMPYASSDELVNTNNEKFEQNNQTLNFSDKTKSKPSTTKANKSLFDFVDFYKNGIESHIDSTGDDDDEDEDEDVDDVDNDSNYKSDHSDIISNQSENEEQSSEQIKPTKSDRPTFDGSDTDLDDDSNDEIMDNPDNKDDAGSQQSKQTKKIDDSNQKEEEVKKEEEERKIRRDPELDDLDEDLNEESLKMDEDSDNDEQEDLNLMDQGDIDDTEDGDLSDTDTDLLYGTDDRHRFGLMGLPFNLDSGMLSHSVSLPASLAAGNNNNTSMQTLTRSMSDSVSESDATETTSKDPILYQNLLPKPGSTDNTWETLMEVQKASETVKLQQLVDNIEHKLNDPNQCIICQRVLSCKSALQMHYRTHTGERPFKCKICGRAFTTKGNLKTHMGVHRVKPPLRMLHQCPICHKQFTNALVLQQHIRLHSIDPNQAMPPDLSPEMLNEFNKTSNQAVPNPLSFPRSFLPGLGFNGSPFPPLPPPATSTASSSLFSSSFLSEMVTAKQHQLNQNSSQSSPLDLFNSANFPMGAMVAAAAASTTTDDTTNDASTLKEALDDNNDNDVDDEDDHGNDEDDDYAASDLSTPKEKRKRIKQDVDEEVDKQSTSTTRQLLSSAMTPEDIRSISDTTEIEEEQPMVSPIKRKKIEEKQNINQPTTKKKQQSQETTLSALEHHVMKSTSEASDAGIDQPGMKFMPTKTLNNSLNDKNTNVLDSTPNMDGNGDNNHEDNRSMEPSKNGKSDKRGFPSTPFAGLPYHPTGRPNTTCRICLKTFACFSALEIHYRSHTKERPFKCEVCDRGFSTKGNMKQHMLTHKIRDLPPDLYTTISPTSNTTLGNFLTSNSITKIIGKQVNNALNNPINMNPHHQHHNSNNNSTNPSNNPNNNNNNNNNSNNNAASSNNSNSSSRVSSPHTPNGNSMDSMDKFRNIESPATESSQNTNPRSSSSSSNKHMCNICNKPFSSGSALQIHMRTHTGDKPFKCTICGRAFTTKGNLKVHMGTHIYNNNPSRRGRRMSIDLPGLSAISSSSPVLSLSSSSTAAATASSNAMAATATSQSSSSPVMTKSMGPLPPPPPPPLPPSEVITPTVNDHPSIQASTNPETDLFFRYLTPHFLNSAGSDAGQFALQQMMLMKMMSNHQQQQHQPLISPTDMRLDKSFMMNMVQANRKRGNNGSNNGNDDDVDGEQDAINDNNSNDGVTSKQACESEIDLNNQFNNGAQKRRTRSGSATFAHHGDDNNEDEDNDGVGEDEIENSSFRSDRSHQADDHWLTMKPLKCTLCNHVCISPTDFDEHIKAHLHAAAASVAAATNSMSTANNATMKTPADVVS